MNVGRASLPAFLCHPRLYTRDAGGRLQAPDGVPYFLVREVQDIPASSEHYPNKATTWIQAHSSAICATNFALLDRGVLFTVDLLVATPAGPQAVFILFSDGDRRLYRRAVKYVLHVKQVCKKEYNFHPQFLLLHVTGRGLLRRKKF